MLSIQQAGGSVGEKIYIKGVSFSDPIITFAIPIEVLFPWNRNDLI